MTATRSETLPRATSRRTHPVLTMPVVRATGAAMNAVRGVERRHGPVVLVLAGEGDTRCVRAADFRPGSHDVHLGAVCCTPVHADRRDLDTRPLTAVVVDVQTGDPGAASLGAGPGQHFVTIERELRAPRTPTA